MTNLQIQTIKDLVENGGKVGSVMRRNGYSKATAKTPQKLTNSLAWKQVMNQYLPDSKLFKKHEEALDATKWNDFTGDREADHAIRLKAVDMAYKLKGHSVDLSSTNTQINISFDGTGYIPPSNTLDIKPTLKTIKK